jgi:hypothetical protein
VPPPTGLQTSVEFNENPLITLTGSVKEERKEERKKSRNGLPKRLGPDLEDSVTFVQTVTLKSKVKTTVTGNVVYMACDMQKCLMPTSVPFTVKIGE